jgi:hypothetical protein
MAVRGFAGQVAVVVITAVIGEGFAVVHREEVEERQLRRFGPVLVKVLDELRAFGKLFFDAGRYEAHEKIEE